MVAPPFSGAASPAHHRHLLGGKRELEAEVTRLTALVDAMGINEREALRVELDRIQQVIPVLREEEFQLLAAVVPLRSEVSVLSIDRERVTSLHVEAAQLEAQRDAIIAQTTQLQHLVEETSILKEEYNELKRQVIETREAIILQEVGAYDYRHPLDDVPKVAQEKERTREARERQREEAAALREFEYEQERLRRELAHHEEAAAALHDRRWLILPILCLSVFVVVVDNTIVNVALPRLSRDLGASTTALQWIVDAYSLSFAGLLLAGGGVGDRLGRKAVMQVGLVFFGLFSAAAAACHTTGSLIAARALMGVAAAFIFPASLAILTSTFTDHSERQKALGIWGATSGIAVAFGPITGGALLEHFWYGSIFLVNVPIVIITLISGQLLIPNLATKVRHRFDVPGVLISTCGVALLVFAIIEGPQWGWGSVRTLSGFAAGAALLLAFTILELKTRDPLLDVRVFMIPRFSGGALAISVGFFCLFGFIFLITQYFQLVKGYSTLSAGVHTLPFAIVAGIFTPIAAVAALKLGSRLVVGVGLLMMAGGLIVAGFTSTPQASYFGRIIIGLVLLALGLSCITASATEAVMGSLAVDQFGAGAAVNNTTREFGGTLGVAVFGSVFASAYAPKITKAFNPYPIPAGAKQAAHESMAAALTVIAREPSSARPVLQALSFSAFGTGFKIACIVGSAVALLGAFSSFRLLPGRNGTDPDAASGKATM
jgi:EmrB/QacA subfamily drug resistance transporter